MLVQLDPRRRRPTDAVSRASRRVALVVMPVHVPDYPSLAVSTLSAGLGRRGHDVDVHCLNLEAAVQSGVATYREVGSEASWYVNAGEWLFSHPSITPGAADTDTFRAFLSKAGEAVSGLLSLDLDELRSIFDRALAKWAEDIRWSAYDVVGFSVSFQQLNASLRLARAIKRRSPHVRVVLGGSSMEHPMGGAVLARYPWLDAVFAGYADRSFPAWVESLPPRSEQPIADDGPSDLDELPVPAFDEYVSALSRLGLERCVVPSVLMETSRGCWYGQKQHCTFCGMNGLQMRFRQKSPERAYAEISELARYGLPIQAADNIVPRDYFETLFPRLEQRGPKQGIFYMVKSNIDRTELLRLKNAGVTRVQPGIESLSSDVLRLMKKGVSGIQNVWTIRACEELGICCDWAILWGFPGERAEEYEKMAALVRKLTHLRPPMGTMQIQLLRHSPNFEQAEHHGFTGVRPHASYALAFGDHERLHDQAYSFSYEYADGREPDSYTHRARREAQRWIESWRRRPHPRCEIFFIRQRRVLVDTRRPGTLGRAFPNVDLIDDDAWALFEMIESPVPKWRLEKDWSRPAPLAPLLDRFLTRAWALESDGRVVRLAVVRPNPAPLAEAWRTVRGTLQQFARTRRRRREPAA